MPAPRAWERPSPRVAELIRAGASLMLGVRDAVFAEVDAAVLADPGSPLAADPVLAAAVRRSNHFNLTRWAEANVADPGVPVEAVLAPETLSVARDVVRRGLDVTALHTYRVGQNVGWQRWMALAFELTSDPSELRELLEVSARSIFAYVESTIDRLSEQIEHERDALTRGTHAQRLEVVTLLLEGAPIAPARASHRLGYALDRVHTAAIVWSEATDIAPSLLDRGAEAIGRAAAARPLIVLAAETALWVWVAGDPKVALVQAALDELPDIRVALGPAASGPEGFRRSHLDALATQRLMLRASSAMRLASYDDVAVVALTAGDEERADAFVRRTLGSFAAAPPVLRDTARTYLREGQNASRAARALFTHRNTVLARLAKMEELLPAPLAGRSLPVALALEILHWRAPGDAVQRLAPEPRAGRG